MSKDLAYYVLEVFISKEAFFFQDSVRCLSVSEDSGRLGAEEKNLCSVRQRL